MDYAKVAVNLTAKNLFREFTYRVPPALQFLQQGWRVVVPFGKKMLEGFIVEEDKNPDLSMEIRPIHQALGDAPWFDREMLSTAYWLSQYYMCTLAEALRLFIPGKKSIAVKSGDIQYKLKEKMERTFVITSSGKAAYAAQQVRGKSQLTGLALLLSGSVLSAADLAQKGVTSSVLRALKAKGWLEEKSRRVLRDSYQHYTVPKETMDLTPEQKVAVIQVDTARKRGEYRTFLLHGITGSGKTEVYLRLAAQALSDGQQVMVLVPEIGLTGQIVKRFKAWFGDSVAVAHSKLSASERSDVWEKMRSGRAQVLIGVRSAVFCPFQNLGLIVIDEEHETTYKQEERPSYHARLVAQYRAHYRKIPVVLGSATPDLESYYLARSGTYTLLPLTHRAKAGSHLPEVAIADMRAELQQGNRGVLSAALKNQLEETLSAGEQAIILLNRRGFSTFVLCRDCGESLLCPHCAVSLVYHAKKQLMECHYCGYTAPVPTVCPHCGSKRIRFFGTGTEKAEQEIAALSDQIKILRMDQDSTREKFAQDKILKGFASGRYNVLLGTQMVAKGHDIPNVTLVGVLSADSLLNLPDYRSGERCFALLTQAAGRAGRGDKPGKVVLQAYDADSPILAMAARQDYAGFARMELRNRKELHYPPFTRLLKVTVQHKKQEEGLAIAQKLVNALEAWQLETEQELKILGPFPAIIAKVKELYRIHVILKSSHMKAVKDFLRTSEFRGMKNVSFDVDPISVM